jgi:RimJ/RimL family protein N-acetyltransferase
MADRDNELVPGTLAGGDILIETERLLLRRVTAADLDELIAIHADADIERFMGGFDQDRATDWLARVDQTWREHGYARLAIADRATGRLLGRSGLQYVEQFAETELGWTLRRDAWGCGYATEAARACADWAFRDFEISYLTSLIEPENERSIKVARRLGMTPLRNETWLERSFIVYAVTRGDWLAP